MLYHFPNAVAPELSDRRPTTDQESIELRMAGATFHDRYTERLSDTDLGKAIYVYARRTPWSDGSPNPRCVSSRTTGPPSSRARAPTTTTWL